MAPAARRNGVYLIVVSGNRSDPGRANLFAAMPGLRGHTRIPPSPLLS
jgi:hypothetical protein